MPTYTIIYRYRSAKTGKYVTEAYAKKHPGETVKEAIKVFTPKKTASKKKK